LTVTVGITVSTTSSLLVASEPAFPAQSVAWAVTSYTPSANGSGTAALQVLPLIVAASV